MIYRRAVFSSCITLLCVYATGGVHQAVASEKITPSLKAESTARVGEEILHQGQVFQRAAIHLSREIKFGKSGQYALTPGYYFRTGESDGWETFSPADSPDAGRVKKAPGALTLQGSFHYSNDGKTIGVITNFYQAINTTAKGITRTTRPALSRDTVQRSLVYGGTAGSKIRLGYRESWKNITRPSRDVFVDCELADSKVVEFKGARIEVLELTDKNIRYRLLRAFDSAKK